RGPAHRAARARARAAGRRRALARLAARERSRDRGPAARGRAAPDVQGCAGMTVMRTLRALPTLLRIGVAETVAYRAEFLVWILTMTMPLVMLGLWRSVASEAPFAHYQSRDFVAYYLANLIVRNLTSSWVAWQMSEEIRMG